MDNAALINAGTIVSAIAALLSAIAATIALYLNNKQGKIIERDLSERLLLEQNNSLNLSRYYRELFKEISSQAQDAIDQISTTVKFIPENDAIIDNDTYTEIKSSFKSIAIPKSKVSDYHLINYRPSSAFEIIKMQTKLESLSEIMSNYTDVINDSSPLRKSSDILHVLTMINAEYSEIKNIVDQGYKNIQIEIAEVEKTIELTQINIAA